MSMKLSEKKFICDLASMLFAAGVLGSAVPLFVNRESYMHMIPLIFALGLLMFLSLGVRSWFCGSRRRMWGCIACAGISLIFCVGSVLLFGGR